MNLKEKIADLAQLNFEHTVEIRRYIHQHPELSFQEFKTSEFVQSKLREWNIPFRSGFVKTGIVADIEGKKPLAHGKRKKVIALRADMDALPINEDNVVEYKSVHQGVMHACGHDVHTASLLGVAKLLKSIEYEFSGIIRLIFQPGEELLPGGAKLLLEEGALADNEPELILAQHVFPELEAGKIGFRSGMYMASTDEIYITINGKGGHGAMPNQLIDTVLITSHIIVALQQIVSRRAPVIIPTVLSFGKVEANGATNIIPDKVSISGTFRTMDEEWRKNAHILIKNMAESIATGMGASCDVDIRVGYPFLINHEATTEKAKALTVEYLGAENVIQLGLRMTGEDFAYYAQKYPVTFYRLGVGIAGQKMSNLHSSTFNIDEKALQTSVGTMAWLAVSFLNDL